MVALEAAGYLAFGAVVLWLVIFWSNQTEDEGSVVSRETRTRLWRVDHETGRGWWR